MMLSIYLQCALPMILFIIALTVWNVLVDIIVDTFQNLKRPQHKKFLSFKSFEALPIVLRRKVISCLDRPSRHNFYVSCKTFYRPDSIVRLRFGFLYKSIQHIAKHFMPVLSSMQKAYLAEKYLTTFNNQVLSLLNDIEVVYPISEENRNSRPRKLRRIRWCIDKVLFQSFPHIEYSENWFKLLKVAHDMGDHNTRLANTFLALKFNRGIDFEHLTMDMISNMFP